MEVIWGHIFGHGEVKLPPIFLKHWKVKYSYYFSFDTSLAMVWFFFFFLRSPDSRGSGTGQLSKKTPDFTEISKNMDKIMPNGEKKITDISPNRQQWLGGVHQEVDYISFCHVICHFGRVLRGNWLQMISSTSCWTPWWTLTSRTRRSSSSSWWNYFFVMLYIISA